MMIKSKKKYFFLSMMLVLLFSFFQVAYTRSLDTVKVKLAIFPFNDMSTNTFDTNIPAVLRSELSRYEFIEVIPVETVTRKIYKIEPYRGEEHRNGLGRDYYFWGYSQEKAGQGANALENYEKSLTFLKPSAEIFQKAEEAIGRLSVFHEE